MLLVGAFISKHPADALRIGEKKSIRYASTDKHNNQIDDVLCNPVNSENPDSKPGVRGKFILKPDEMNDLTATNAIVPQIGKCTCIMGGRMQFAPTNVISK